MDNALIIGLIAAITLAAVVTLAKRAGRKGCCGSSDYKPRKKKLKQVIATRVFRVEGMHCPKCSNRVTEAVNDIPHAAGIVDLKKGTVTVSYEQEIPDELIRERIRRAGYTVTEILG